MALDEKLEALTDSLKEYTETNYELIKLEVIDHSATIVSGIITTIVLTVILVLFAFFGGMYLAFYLSEVLGNNLGFAIVGGFYLALAIFVYLFKKGLIVKPVCENIVSKRMNTAAKQPTTE